MFLKINTVTFFVATRKFVTKCQYKLQLLRLFQTKNGYSQKFSELCNYLFVSNNN